VIPRARKRKQSPFRIGIVLLIAPAMLLRISFSLSQVR
jgi:hypothetical protein